LSKKRPFKLIEIDRLTVIRMADFTVLEIDYKADFTVIRIE